MLPNMNDAGRNCFKSAWPIVSAIAAALIVCAAVSTPRAWADDPNATVATVGAHKISEKDLDSKIKPQMEQLEAKVAEVTLEIKRKALESMTDDYLVQLAADHDKLSVPEYLKKEFSGKDAVTDAEAKAFYDKNKGQGTA